jgi:hypothetical protein
VTSGGLKGLGRQAELLRAGTINANTKHGAVHQNPDNDLTVERLGFFVNAALAAHVKGLIYEIGGSQRTHRPGRGQRRDHQPAPRLERGGVQFATSHGRGAELLDRVHHRYEFRVPGRPSWRPAGGEQLGLGHVCRWPGRSVRDAIGAR